MDCEVTVNMHEMYIGLYINQKSSGNGKDLIQIHVSTTLVGRNHVRVRRYYTFGVTQIGLQDRGPQTVVFGAYPMGH